MSKSWKNTRLWCKGSPRFACHSNPFLYPSIFSFLRRSEKVQLIFGSNSLFCQFQTCYLKHFLHSITAIIDLVLSYFMNEGCFDILFIFNKDFVSKLAGDSKSSNLFLHNNFQEKNQPFTSRWKNIKTCYCNKNSKWLHSRV